MESNKASPNGSERELQAVSKSLYNSEPSEKCWFGALHFMTTAEGIEWTVEIENKFST